MKILSCKIEQPKTTEINLEYKDIAKWFETAKILEIQYALNEIGRVLSEMEDEMPFEDVRHGISGKISPQSKDFWKSLVQAME